MSNTNLADRSAEALTPAPNHNPEGFVESEPATGALSIKSNSDSLEQKTTGTKPDVSFFKQKLGLVPERIASFRAGLVNRPPAVSTGHRSVHTDAIKANHEAMIADYGVNCICAESVRAWLVEHNLGRTKDGRPMRGANAIGDALGEKGLGLPWIIIGGKKRYALAWATASTAEKEAAQVELNQLPQKELEELPYA